MKYPAIPEELKPTESDYEYYLENHDLDQEEVDYYYDSAWEDYIDVFVKSNFNDYKREMKVDRNDEKENGEIVPPFDEWHEVVHGYILTLWNYIEQNQAEINFEFKEYMKDIVEVSDYFEVDE